MGKQKRNKFIYVVVGLALIMGMLYIADIVDYALGSILFLVGTFIIVFALGADKQEDHNEKEPNDK